MNDFVSSDLFVLDESLSNVAALFGSVFAKLQYGGLFNNLLIHEIWQLFRYPFFVDRKRYLNENNYNIHLVERAIFISKKQNLLRAFLNKISKNDSRDGFIIVLSWREDAKIDGHASGAYLYSIHVIQKSGVVLSSTDSIEGSSLLFDNQEVCISIHADIYDNKISFLTERYTFQEVGFIQAIEKQLLEYAIKYNGVVCRFEDDAIDELSSMIAGAIKSSLSLGAL